MGSTGGLSPNPHNFSATRSSTGRYVITHRLGSNAYMTSITQRNGTKKYHFYNAVGVNTHQILCYDGSASGVPADLTPGAIDVILFTYDF